jgi:streptomycin 6-kinase
MVVQSRALARAGSMVRRLPIADGGAVTHNRTARGETILGIPDERLRGWLLRWGLEPDGEPVATPSSLLLPVLAVGAPAMLKVALIAEEARGGRQLVWWSGRGAARVLAIEGDAVLMERAAGGSLAPLAQGGRDGEATSIICRLAAQLHRPVPRSGPDLVPLETWFEPLLQASAGGEDFALAATLAKRLLAAREPEVSLHGDLHHHNVLDFGGGDWRAIDPKGLRGERTFDFVHLLRNPDPVTVGTPGRLEARVAQIASEGGIGPVRLLAWALAFSALSAIWSTQDGDCPTADLALLQRCRALLSLSEPLE